MSSSGIKHISNSSVESPCRCETAPIARVSSRTAGDGRRGTVPAPCFCARTPEMAEWSYVHGRNRVAAATRRRRSRRAWPQGPVCIVCFARRDTRPHHCDARILAQQRPSRRPPSRPALLPSPPFRNVRLFPVRARHGHHFGLGRPHLGAFCRAETPATPHRSPPGGSCPGESRQQGEIAVPLQHLARHPHAAERRHGHDLHRPLPRKRPGQGESLP